MPERTSTTYPWLTIDEDGSMGADMLDETPAEMDRRLVILQELQRGCVVLAEDVKERIR